MKTSMRLLSGTAITLCLAAAVLVVNEPRTVLHAQYGPDIPPSCSSLSGTFQALEDQGWDFWLTGQTFVGYMGGYPVYELQFGAIDPQGNYNEQNSIDCLSI